jgi:molybdenum cofactor guanylyltransferase
MTERLIVIIAGGGGRRIGGNKPLRLLGGERLIDRAVRIARLWSEDVRVSLRTAGQLPVVDLPVLLDDPGICGPLAGLSTALAACQASGRQTLLTIPCDVPFLPDDLAPRLEQEIGDRLAAIASSGADLHPTCALWRPEVLDHLPRYVESGQRSLIGFAEAIGSVSVSWDAAHFFNVNDLADLETAEIRLRSEVENLDHVPGGEPGGVRP